MTDFEGVDMNDDTRVRSIADFAAATVTTSRSREQDRAAALRALIGEAQVVYALRLHDGVIKIGCTTDLQLRRNAYRGAEIIGFMFGDFDDEAAIHDSLQPHLAHGREYYVPAPAVIDAVNLMRDSFGIPRLAA